MNFKFSRLVQASPNIFSAALGVDAANPLAAADLEKAVKLAGDDNYVLCANGDDIEGTLAAVNPDTVNDGFSFGSVDSEGRRVATVDVAQVGTLAVGEFAVAGTQAARGLAGGLVVTEGAGVLYRWRVISILTGTGVAGDSVLIEHVK